MSKLNFCANISWLYSEEPDLKKRFALAKADGFKGVEIAFPYDQDLGELVKAKEAADIKVVLINSGSGQTLGSAANSCDANAFMSELDTAITYAKALKCDGIHLMAGRIGSNQTKQKAQEMFVKNLKLAAPKLSENGLAGLIEPINKYDVPDYFLSDFTQGMEIVKAVAMPNIKLQYDFYHQHQMEGGLMSKFKLAGKNVGHVQISQLPLRAEPFAEGEINYAYIFKALQDLNYSGWIGLEYRPLVDTQHSLKWFKNLEK